MQDQTGVPAWAKGAVAIIAALTALVVSLAAAGVIGGNDTIVQPPPPAPAAVPTTVAVDGPDKNAEPDRPLELDQDARALYKRAAVAPESLDVGGGLRGRDSTPVAQHEGPLATPNFPGCDTRILPTNWSNRISTVKAVAVHYTAGGNLPGLSDMNGLTGFASGASAGVSWHFLIDAEGHCYYSVPLANKAWTIGNLNSETVNIEVVGRGNEPTYPAAPAGAAKLRQVVRRIAAIYHLPLQLGAVSNCHVTRPGIVTHWMGGLCSGGHIDIKPYDIAAVVRAIATDPCDTSCQARRRQRAVVQGRDRKHKATHTQMSSLGCRRRIHSRPPGEYRRAECRALKRRDARQRRGEMRARRKLAQL